MTTTAISQVPVVIVPGQHIPKKHPAISSAKSPEDLLKQSCPDLYQEGSTRIVASSFDNHKPQDGEVYPSSSSFVRSAIEAWGRHSHLVLRPEDIWFTILVQVNFYMQKHAENVRHIFVAHKGKQKIHVERTSWPMVVESFREEVQRRIKTPWMSDWISPGFSTSTFDDERTATILMMGLMKNFFDYSGGIICGIPSVTLLGTLQDWERILQKVDRLEDFGTEPKEYASRLRPILTRIVGSFTAPSSVEAKGFWDELVQAKVKRSHTCGLPPKEYIISGWILGFFYWDHTGSVRRTQTPGCRDMSPVSLDGIEYGMAPLDKIPIGYAKADFTMINDHGGNSNKPFNGWVLAGSIGKRITNGAPEGYTAPVVSYEDTTTDQVPNVIQVQDVSGPSAGLQDNERTGTTGFFSKLKSFARMHPRKEVAIKPEETQHPHEDQPVQPRINKDLREDGHSTIQPMSGWFLFGPANQVNSPQDEELDGPTVDAINSCGNAQHFQESWE